MESIIFVTTDILSTPVGSCHDLCKDNSHSLASESPEDIIPTLVSDSLDGFTILRNRRLVQD